MTRRHATNPLALVLAGSALWAWPSMGLAAPLVLVDNGQPVATIWHAGDAKRAANDIAEHLNRISGAQIAVKVAEEDEGPGIAAAAIVLGHLALDLGLPPPPDTCSGDGYRVVRRGNHILMAGETERSTFYASSHFLETLGCRWFFGEEWGVVIPDRETVSVDVLDVAETPDFISRRVWGPNWRAQDWQDHNRLGGLPMATGHDWAHLPKEQYAEDHPEYYALRNGERRPGNWLCTSNPDVQRIFAEGLIAQVKGKGTVSVSVSPPDGRGYCQCEECCKLDDATYLEPSSGSIVVTDRYVRFFNAVAGPVREVNPDAILSFYAYADYSRAPKHVDTALDNLCAWIAPIRFCRFHSMNNPLCGPRQRLRLEVGRWQSVVPKLGWREYNYNLAESVLPLAKMAVWRDDIPRLHERGCLGLSIECLFFWHLYGPHTYLVTKLAWDADADVDAIMDDFYTTFGQSAGPYLKAYWERLDRAYRETPVHVGSFYGLHAIWTPELVAACSEDLAQAMQAADNDTIRKRVGMFQAGLQNAIHYLALRAATNECDFVRAKRVHDEWLAHMDGIVEARGHVIREYKYGYVPRFLSKAVEQGHELTTGENRKLVQLPDTWGFRYDADNHGEEQGWHRDVAASDEWREVRTYSATLAEQGVDEELTWMWYRTTFAVPEIPDGTKLTLWFAEVDGKPTRVFLNGELAGETRDSRRPFGLDVTGKIVPDRNTVAVQIDHHHISELQLGGIIKPVMLCAVADQAP